MPRFVQFPHPGPEAEPDNGDFQGRKEKVTIRDGIRENIPKMNIPKIRLYTQENDDLREAHHFNYDLHLNGGSTAVELIVMGINPGETDEELRMTGGRSSEGTSEYDFQGTCPSKSRRNWNACVEAFCGTRNAVFAECFFWSSYDVGHFKQRYGNIERSKHLDFCTRLNRELIGYYQPRAIVFPGIGKDELVSRLYWLRKCRGGTIRGGKKNHRLVEVYTDGHRPWVFTKHWTGARLSREERSIVKNSIAKICG